MHIIFCIFFQHFWHLSQFFPVLSSFFQFCPDKTGRNRFLPLFSGCPGRNRFLPEETQPCGKEIKCHCQHNGILPLSNKPSSWSQSQIIPLTCFESCRVGVEEVEVDEIVESCHGADGIVQHWCDEAPDLKHNKTATVVKANRCYSILAFLGQAVLLSKGVNWST